MEPSALDTLVRERRSIRGYKKQLVPKALNVEIIDIAKGAPSSMNPQPWFFHVVTGETVGANSRRQYGKNAFGCECGSRNKNESWL